MFGAGLRKQQLHQISLCKNNVITQHCPVTMVCLKCPGLDNQNSDAGVGWQTNDDDYTASTTDESVKNRSEMLFTRDAPQELTNQRPGSCHVTELWTNENWAGLIWLRPVTSVRSLRAQCPRPGECQSEWRISRSMMTRHQLISLVDWHSTFAMLKLTWWMWLRILLSAWTFVINWPLVH